MIASGGKDSCATKRKLWSEESAVRSINKGLIEAASLYSIPVAWLDGFRRRHPKVLLRSPQPLSYSRAL